VLEPDPLTEAAVSPDPVQPLLEIRDLVKHFPLARGVRVWDEKRAVHAVDHVDLDVLPGEFLAIVGESGSGKTTLANCIAGFLPPTQGVIRLEGRRVVETSANGGAHKRDISRFELAKVVQMVFQDPSSALNPRQTIGSALLEPLLVHKALPKTQARIRVQELLELTGIQKHMRRRYPHELNSGQRQRVVIARALALEPKLLVADEPVSRLDVSMQSQILNLLLDLHRDLALTIVFITHDLSVVRQVADRVIVMYLGRIMESSDADTFFTAARHPYSQALIASTPRFHGSREELAVLEGEIPSPIFPPAGCPFTTRCQIVVRECSAAVPPLREVARDHLVACIRR
jgi:oligopeptide/dipeptide ABC transporter ATP-binding protein